MRIEIKTQNPVKDNDIKALYIIAFAFTLLSERMIVPTLQYFADKFGFELKEKIK